MKKLGKKNTQKGKYHYMFKVISDVDTYELEVDSVLKCDDPLWILKVSDKIISHGLNTLVLRLSKDRVVYLKGDYHIEMMVKTNEEIK